MTDIKSYLQNKDQCKDKSIPHSIHIFPFILMVAKHLTLTFMMI